jgi:hypothetical protein
MMNSKSISLLVAFMCSAPLALAGPTATEAYLEIHQKELAAKSYEDLTKLRSKSSIANDKAISAEEKVALFPLFQATMPTKVKVLKESIDGNKATLDVEVPAVAPANGMVEHTTGTVTLELEDGQWKLFKESWHAKAESVPN